MLDFVKAMEIANRACSAYGDFCYSTCPCRADGKEKCVFAQGTLEANWSEVERRLLAWDKAHPEPQYPTWEEWQRENFPGATHNICPRSFVPDGMWICGSKDCNECMCEEIPADIAKKLGIKPKEVTP